MNTEVLTRTTQKKYPPVSDDGIYYPSTDPNAMPETDIHFKLIANFVLILEAFLKNRSDANAFGDLMFYYEPGNRQTFVAPDVSVCFGIDKSPRRVYKLWEEKSVPSVIVEIASESTWREDLTKKFALYQNLGVNEYYVFDPEYKFLAQPLLAFHLNEQGELAEAAVNHGRVFSESLGLELVDTGETLRLFNPETNEFLMTIKEIEAKAEKAERENIRLKAEIEKLKSQIQNQ